MPTKLTKLLAAVLALCLAAAPLAVPAGAADGTVHTVPDLGNVLTLIESDAVADGDVIRLAGSGFVRTNDEAPWVIRKSVVIEGGTLQLDVSGVVLDVDVTFRNVGLSFNKPARNSLMANGHAVTLNNVTCANLSFNLFGGGLVNSNNEPFTLPAPGNHSVITILGKTTLQGKDDFGPGNVYAGNLAMGGMTAEHNGPDDNAPANAFTGDVLVDIQGNIDSGALGKVYACGAQQRIPVGAGNGKVTLADAEAYTVSGAVSVQGPLPDIEGAGATRTAAVYRDVSGNNYQTTRTLLDLDGLAVESGHLRLEAESRLRGAKDLALFDGATLDLSAFAKVSILEVGRLLSSSIGAGGQVAAGGVLVLGQEQTVKITGEVPGPITVAIGGANHDGTASITLPLAGHTYLQAPNSAADSFRLLPYSSSPSMTLVRGDDGSWTTSSGSSGGDETLISSFRFATKAATVDLNGENAEAAFEMEALQVNEETAYLDEVPLTITVDQDTTLERVLNQYDYYIYTDTQGKFSAEVAENVLYVTTAQSGTHTIQVTLPQEVTVDGATLSDTATLTVNGGTQTPDPDPDPDPDPNPDPDPDPNPDPDPKPDPDPDPKPDHSHSWSGQWTSDEGSHWHECAAQGCDVTENSRKDGYAAHAPGDWIVDTPATADRAGSRHKECTVCAYVTARETIPATGGTGGGNTGGNTGGGNTGGSTGGSTGGGNTGGNTGGGAPVQPPKGEDPAPAPAPEAPEFSDLTGHWAADAIQRVVAQGLFRGTADGVFSPNTSMTRAMVMTILARLDGADLSDGAVWYEGGMKWAADRGVSDGSAPNASVTREQLVTMLYRYAQSVGRGQIENGTEVLRFADTGDVADWAKEPMTWAVSAGVLQGTSADTLSPQLTATRAEVAVMLDRFIALLK